MNDLWKDEEELYFAGIPEALWHEEEWIELLADQVEISRLLDMKVLVRKEEYSGDVLGSLTTKFVRDWRTTLYDDGGKFRMRWMRRSCFVAREFAVDRRDDAYSQPACCHYGFFSCNRKPRRLEAIISLFCSPRLQTCVFAGPTGQSN